jgi:hypothetical protein
LTPADPLAPYVTVFLNGRDVTKLCTQADDENGYVKLIPENWRSIDWTELPEYHHFGNVRICVRSDAPKWASEVFANLHLHNGLEKA